MLAWNAAADELFGFASMDGGERNILRYMVATPAARVLFGSDWAQEAQRMTALFRVTYDQRAGDPMFQELASDLSGASEEFRSWWCSHRVATPSAGVKTLHPAGHEGVADVYATFQANDDPELKLALYTRQDAHQPEMSRSLRA